LIAFSVSYSLREYLSFVRDYLPDGLAEMAAQGKSRGVSARVVRPFALVGAAVAFFFKKRRMPVCDFTIDEAGIRRATRDGVLVIPWNEVRRVYRYTEGYLVREHRGAVALPYRCFSPDMKANMERLIAAYGGGADQATR